MWYDIGWSMSKLKTLEKCPLKFYLSYILKMECDGADDVLERDLGTFIHYVFEMMYSGKNINQALNEAYDKYGDLIPEENLHRIDSMIPNVRRFDNIMHEMDNGKVDTLIPEQEVAVDKNFQPVPFNDPSVFFRGIIDFSWRAGNNSLVLDFKKGGGAFLTKYHAPQLVSYLLLDYCMNPFESSQSYIYYVEAGQLSPGPSLNGENIEQYTKNWLINKIDSAVQAVRNEGIFNYRKSSLCKWCEYAALCKKGKGCGELESYRQQSKVIASA